jgi:membrane protein DedA with SNARE-associated domain
MSHARFITLTTLAVIPWSILFVSLGKTLGDNWANIGDISGPYIKYAAVIAVLLAAIYFIVKLVRRKKERS